jgi:carbonic anhydrase/acetyltransferase-like protein (isoleucine patch superfamily)
MIRNNRARTMVALIAVLLPARARRAVLVGALGYEIPADAVIGRSVVAVDRLVMASGSVIGHLNLIRRCERVVLGKRAEIGHANWITGVRTERGYFPGRQRSAILTLGDSAAITHRHFVDCSDRVELGDFSILAGVHSQVLTHGIDIDRGNLTSAPVLVGDRVLINSGTILLAGAVVSGRSVIGAGSVVRGKLTEEGLLYAGSPAVPKRSLDRGSGWLVREEAHLQ